MDRNQKPGRLPEEDKEDVNDEEIIDLTQVYDNGEDEEIIDLSEVLEPPADVSDHPDEMEETAIPLLDVVTIDESSTLPQESNDEVIDLLAVAPSAKSDHLEPGSKTDKSESNDNRAEKAVETITVTEQQLEDALTRVIENVYGEKIEQLLIQTVEKAIKQEIEEIRRALLDDNTSDI